MIEVIPLKYGTMFKRVFNQPDIFNQSFMVTHPT